MGRASAGFEPLPADTRCDNCGQLGATIKWFGEGGTLAFTHGWWKPWCELCALKANLEYAEKQARRIPDLRKQLADRGEELERDDEFEFACGCKAIEIEGERCERHS
jgi:hypothetical protein